MIRPQRQRTAEEVARLQARSEQTRRAEEESDDAPEVLPGRQYEPRRGPRGAILTPAEEQALLALREVLRAENAATGDLDDAYDDWQVGVLKRRRLAPPETALAVARGASLALPATSAELRQAARRRSTAAAVTASRVVVGHGLGHYQGEVVEAATRMYGDTEAPTLIGLGRFLSRALADQRLFRSPIVRKELEHVHEAVGQAHDRIAGVVDALSTMSPAELGRSDAGLAALVEARSLLVFSEYDLSALLAEHAPSTREESERIEEGLDLLDTPEAKALRPLQRRRYGNVPEYMRNRARSR